MGPNSPYIWVKNVFLVVSNHFQVNLKVTQNLKKSDEVGLTPPGQPVFWVNQVFAKFERQLKKFHLMFFFQFFLHRHLG